MFWNAKNGSIKIDNTDMDYVSFGHGSKNFIIMPGLSDGLLTVKGKALLLAGAYTKFFNDYTVYIFSRKNDMPEGYYVVATFKAAPEFPSELERLFNIDETIMRSMVIRLEYDAAEKKAAKIAAAEAAVEAAEVVVETETETVASADAE